MLKVGWASCDITPQRPALIQGQMYSRIGRDAADPLTATALVLDGGTSAGRVLLISCDLTAVSDELVTAVRDRVLARVPDLPGDAIILTATHTHGGPVIDNDSYPHPGGDVMTPYEAMTWVADRAAEAAVTAWESRKLQHIGWAFGHAVVGHNRRAVYAGGAAVMYGSTDRPDFSHVEGYEDHSLDILFVWEPEGRLVGVALAIPCPSQVDEHLEQFTADFWHDIRLELRQRFGQHLAILPLCGAAGDQSPHFLLYGPQEAEMRRRRGLTQRQEIAMQVGDAVERALLCTHPDCGEVPVSHRSRRVALSPRAITHAERDWAAEARREALERGDRPDLWWPRALQDVVDRFDRGDPMPACEVKLHVLRLGDAVLATNPFELFLDYGLQIKARSQAAQTVVVQLAGGTGFYLPSERAVGGGHYGAHPVVAPVGPEGGHEWVEATLSVIDEVFSAPANESPVSQEPPKDAENNTERAASTSNRLGDDRRTSMSHTALVPSDWDPKRAADHVMDHLVNLCLPTVKGAHDSDFVVLDGKAYVVYMANDIQAGEAASWPFIYSALSIVDIATHTVDETVTFAASNKVYDNATLPAGACFVPRIVQKDEQTLRCFFASENPGVRESQTWYIDFDLIRMSFQWQIHRAQIETDQGIFPMQPQHFYRHAAAKGFEGEQKDFGLYMIDGFKIWDGQVYTVLNNFPGGQNALAVLNEDLDTFTVIGDYFLPNTAKLTESAIQRTPDRTWCAISRQEHGDQNYMFAESTDGVHWAPHETRPLVSHGTNSKPTFDHFDGVYYLGWQEATRIHEVRRSVFNIEVSRDGQEWVRKYRFETDKSFQYPTFRQYEGAIYLTVTQGDASDSHKERIMFGRLA
jgi:hypothetical protein